MRGRAFWTIFRKELRSVRKERTIVIAFLIQLFIASFSSVLLSGLLSVYDPEATALSAQLGLRIGVLGNQQSPLVQLMADHNLNLVPFATPEEANAAFDRGQIEAAIYIPEAEADSPKLFVPQSETLETLILLVMTKPLKQYENLLREQRGVEVRFQEIQGLPPTTFEFRYAVLLPLLMFFPAFVTGGMVIDAVAEEIANATLETLWSAPLTLGTILGGKIAAALLLAAEQCALWIALLRLNGIVMQQWVWVLVMATLNAALVAAGAALIAVTFKDRERSQFVYSLGIVLTTSLSYFFDGSPIVMMTRFATGDPTASALSLVAYGALLAGLLALLFKNAARLVTAPEIG